MDGVSAIASVIAVIQLARSVVKICAGYIQEVKDARDDIIILQQTIIGLQDVLQKLDGLIQRPEHADLRTSPVVNHISDCFSELKALEEDLDPGKREKVMNWVGFRALKWPLKRTEMDRIIQVLESYKSSFTLSLQIDQTSRITDLAQSANRIDEKSDLEKLPIARWAAFNSYVDQHEDGCLPGTRSDLLQQIAEWAASPKGKCIFWLNGMAGTGKSTISRTVAKSFEQDNLLAASFFFKRGEEDRGNGMKFFTTISRQLVDRIPQVLPSIRKAIRDDPDVVAKSLREQFDKLILQPLLSLEQGTPHIPTVVIVIDALDECENDNEIRVILQLLPQLRKSNAVRLRVFLTSRPEMPIRLGFSRIGDYEYQHLALHEIPEAVTEKDISLFLHYRFAHIREERRMKTKRDERDGKGEEDQSDWPGNDIIQILVGMTVPLFISAATLCRYVGDPKWNPQLRLNDLLKDQTKYATKMEKIYLPILARLLDGQDDDESEQLVQEFKEIVGAIVLLAAPISVTALSHFFGIDEEVISIRLDSLQSVLNIPDDRDLPVRILHLSFRDFLVTSKSRFHVDEPQTHKNITVRCLDTMRSCLKKDICNLAVYGTRRSEIETQSIHQHLTPELQYSCRYWVHHLVRSKDQRTVIHVILLFLQEHFLHWVEAMSILGLVSEVAGMINVLQTVLHDEDDSAISDFLHDAKRFVLKNRQIADIAPLQLYCSGLLFAPTESITRMAFESELPKWIFRSPEVEENWSAMQQTLEGHSASVQSVAFSPDGRLLVSSSSDRTIRLWDSATGLLQQTLEGHLGAIPSVAFSPDGGLLVSGSFDNTIRLWDPVTGALLRTLEGHSALVQSVAFSPDGRLLVSGSRDSTVRLWETSTGDLQKTLIGHSNSVESVIFSPNSLLLASASSDKTVRLWDATTGALYQTLEGHLGAVLSVAFSPTDWLLVSGSSDNTVRLWDLSTGAWKQTLEGHSGPVQSLAFSPDGRRLVSSSRDNRIRLFDPATGALQQIFEGHSGAVPSVAFSPDGRLLVSGSKDKTVRLWDPAAGAWRQTREGHSGAIQALAFSSNGRLLVSGSFDNTVKLWDTATGALQKTLKGHSGPVLSVTFSPNGRQLVSGSFDNTIRLWDSARGALQYSLTGHSGAIMSLAFSPDGRLLVSGSFDNRVRLWNPATGALQQTLEGHLGSVMSVAFSDDGQLLASGSRDKSIRLWNSTTGALLKTFEGHLGAVQSLAFSPDSRLLVSGSWDRTVRLWDPTSGALQQTFMVEGVVTQLEFSEDGRHLSTNLGPLEIWSCRDKHAPNLPRTTLEITIQEDRWISFNGMKVLWLPSEFRPMCSAVKHTTLALGHASGHVSFLEFTSQIKPS